MKQLKKSHFGVTAKNICMVWGFLVSFILFDLAIDYVSYMNNAWFFVPAAAFLAITCVLAHKMRKRLNAYDIVIKPTLDSTSSE